MNKNHSVKIVSTILFLFALDVNASKRECPPIEEADLYPGAWKKAVNRIVGQPGLEVSDEDQMSLSDEGAEPSVITYKDLLTHVKDQSVIKKLTESSARLHIECFIEPNPAFMPYNGFSNMK